MTTTSEFILRIKLHEEGAKDILATYPLDTARSIFLDRARHEWSQAIIDGRKAFYEYSQEVWNRAVEERKTGGSSVPVDGEEAR